MAQKEPNSNWIVFGQDKYSGVARQTPSIFSSENKILNTLYGPDNKPIAYLMEKPVVKLGFQGSNNV